MENKKRTLKITLVKSLIGRKKSHLGCAVGLGLKRINQSVTVIDTVENRGMLLQIN